MTEYYNARTESKAVEKEAHMPYPAALEFSIVLVGDDVCYAMFFSRELNYWNKSKYFEFNISIAASIKEWMVPAAAEPLKRESGEN